MKFASIANVLEQKINKWFYLEVQRLDDRVVIRWHLGRWGRLYFPRAVMRISSRCQRVSHRCAYKGQQKAQEVLLRFQRLEIRSIAQKHTQEPRYSQSTLKPGVDQERWDPCHWNSRHQIQTRLIERFRWYQGSSACRPDKRLLLSSPNPENGSFCPDFLELLVVLPKYEYIKRRNHKTGGNSRSPWGACLLKNTLVRLDFPRCLPIWQYPSRHPL